jgi:N-acetylneuraminate synthase
MTASSISILGRPVGPGHAPLVIAEVSANHNGDLDRALKILEAAKAAGADAVKLQTYTPDTLTIDHDGPGFTIKGGLWDGYTLYGLYREAQTPWEWHKPLFKRGRELELITFSTPFDETAVDLLEELGAPAYKIASFEAVDIGLIRRVARTGKPMIISTGLADLGDIALAVETARSNGCKELVLLHCVSAYPSPASQMNLRTIPHMAEAFGVVAGLSDHTLGTAVSIAAVSLGAAVIEKHFTLRRADGGPDSAFSLEPEELKALTEGVRTAWESLGHVNYSRAADEQANLVFRRSLYAVKDIAAGNPLTADNVRAIRPGYGLPPRFLPELLGRRVREHLPRGTPLQWNLLE